MFNVLLKTYLGAGRGRVGLHYLRPETAQGIFVNFHNVCRPRAGSRRSASRQIGKSFRNEITPGNFIFRTREFEQMEMEYFVKPGTDEEWHEYWIDSAPRLVPRSRHQAGATCGSTSTRRRSCSHYSKRTVDIEYRFGFPGSEWGELEGIANRTDFDLRTHASASGQDLSYLDAETGERYIPYVIEPAAGVDRVDAGVPARRLHRGRGAERQGRRGQADRAAARSAARAGQGRRAAAVAQRRPVAQGAGRRGQSCASTGTPTSTTRGAIGRRYRRQDEIGTPYCVTVDFDTLEDQAVTVRERDSMKQERVGIDGLVSYLSERLSDC